MSRGRPAIRVSRKDLEVALLFEGIVPPADGRDKTQCPRCSHLRKKHHRPCLVIQGISGYRVRVYCFNCGWSKRIECGGG